MRLVYIK